MMNWEAQQNMIAEAAARFPQEFGLRGFPGDVFTIQRSKCYVNDQDVVQLVTAVRRMVQHKGDGNVRAEWLDFAKGTPAEILAEMVRL